MERETTVTASKTDDDNKRSSISRATYKVSHNCNAGKHLQDAHLVILTQIFEFHRIFHRNFPSFDNLGNETVVVVTYHLSLLLYKKKPLKET
ncbi:hypothetical protein QTP88_024332 [Uroleucon formosanum]